MIVGQNNLQLINQIGALFCSGKPQAFLCKSNVVNRIKTLLDDNLFETMLLPYLANDNFLSFQIIGITAHSPGKVNVKFEFIDIVSGYQAQNTSTAVPVSRVSNNDWFYIFHHMDAGQLTYNFVDVLNDRLIVRVNTPNSYGIVFNQNTTTTGGGGSTWNYGGGGAIEPKPQPVTPGGTPPTQQMPPVQQGSLMPLVIGAAAIFLLPKLGLI